MMTMEESETSADGALDGGGNPARPVPAEFLGDNVPSLEVSDHEPEQREPRSLSTIPRATSSIPADSVAVVLSDAPQNEGEKDVYDPDLFPQPGSVDVSTHNVDAGAWDIRPPSEPADTSERALGEARASVGEQQFDDTFSASKRDLQRPSTSESGHNPVRELRHLIKLIDDELMKRTLWRQEQEKLMHSKNWLYQSTTALKEGLKVRSVAETRAVSSKKKSSKGKARGVFQDGIDLSIPIRLVESPEISSSDGSRGGRIDSAQESSGTNASSEIVTDGDIEKLYHQYYQDYVAVQEQENIVARMADVLGNLSFRLENKLTRLRDRMKSEVMSQTPESGLQEDSRSLSDTPSRSRSGANTPPLVRDYFDKVGDVGIYEERLLELIDTHEEGLIEREFLRDRGDDVQVSNAEFQQIYRQRRQQIERDLHESQMQVEVLLQLCEQAGLKPNAHRKTRHSVYSSSPPESSQHHLDDDVGPIAQIREVRYPMAVSQMEPSGSSRVGEWVQKIQSTAPPDLVPFQSEVDFPDDARVDTENRFSGNDKVQSAQQDFKDFNGPLNHSVPFTPSEKLAAGIPLPPSPGFMSAVD